MASGAVSLPGGGVPALEPDAGILGGAAPIDAPADGAGAFLPGGGFALEGRSGPGYGRPARDEDGRDRGLRRGPALTDVVRRPTMMVAGDDGGGLAGVGLSSLPVEVSQMPPTTLTCPSSGTPIHVEVEAGEPARDSAAVPRVGVKCPHCHEYHAWRKEDVYPEAE